MCAVLGVISTIAWASAPAPNHVAIEPVASAFAQTIANEYVSGQPTSLPEAPGVTSPPLVIPGQSPPASQAAPIASASTPVTYGPVVTSTPLETNNQVLETHNFLVSSATGTSYLLSVVVDVTNPAQPFLAASPTLSPGPYVAQNLGGAFNYQYPPNLAVAPDVSAGTGTYHYVLHQVQLWASALIASDSGIALAQLAGQGKSGYHTLAGFQSASASIAGARLDASGSMVVHVTLVLTPQGANRSSVSSAYDLYVLNPATNPLIVDWGATGSAALLTSNPSPLP